RGQFLRLACRGQSSQRAWHDLIKDQLVPRRVLLEPLQGRIPPLGFLSLHPLPCPPPIRGRVGLGSLTLADTRLIRQPDQQGKTRIFCVLLVLHEVVQQRQHILFGQALGGAGQL